MQISQVDGKKERKGPMVWPPHPPDLTPLDFLLQGYIEDQVYSQRVNMLEDGFMQQFHILQQSRYSASGKIWTIDGTYTELQMALTVNHFAYNFSSCV
jgi:hypothetical protein